MSRLKRLFDLGTDPRKLKRLDRKFSDDHPVNVAWMEGEYDKVFLQGYRNRYPKGLRHEAYDRGFKDS